ncbi:hypothetical protein WSM22_47600 [Cytophagales bacterium WSM2-2]|nr:hypothetical protein WSM22_47600 [Cytophagales bacterium WSM2-2]
MKTLVTLVAGLSLMISAGFSSVEKGALSVSLSNVKKAGKINVAIYRDGEKFPDEKNMVFKQSLDNATDKCEFVFEAVPYGTYAVAIYQDVNGNGKLDTGMFGIPKEPFAFSNNFRPKFGGPSFEKCKFDFSKSNAAIKIEMINSLFGGD